MRNKKLVSDITLDGLFIAILAILTFVPYVGFIPLGFGSVTIFHIPVILGALFLGWKRGLLYGVAFGVISLIKAQQATGVLDVYFINPLISIVPRAIFGLVTGLFGEVVAHANFTRAKKAFIIPGVAVITTMLHTTLVYLALIIFDAPFFLNWAWAGIFASAMLFEAIAAGILIGILYFALEKPFKNRLLKYNKNEENEDENHE